MEYEIKMPDGSLLRTAVAQQNRTMTHVVVARRFRGGAWREWKTRAFASSLELAKKRHDRLVREARADSVSQELSGVSACPVEFVILPCMEAR